MPALLSHVSPKMGRIPDVPASAQAGEDVMSSFFYTGVKNTPCHHPSSLVYNIVKKQKAAGFRVYKKRT